MQSLCERLVLIKILFAVDLNTDLIAQISIRGAETQFLMVKGGEGGRTMNRLVNAVDPILPIWDRSEGSTR